MKSETEIKSEMARLDKRSDRLAMIAVKVLELGMNENDILKEGKWTIKEGEFAQKVADWMRYGKKMPI